MKIISTFLIGLAFMILLTSKVEATEPPSETSITFGGISHHISSINTTTWFHRVALVQHNNWLGGYLKNSYGNDSFVVAYKAYSFRTNSTYSLLYTPITLDLYLGAVRGYDKCFGKFNSVQEANGKDKAEACFLPIVTTTFHTKTFIKPQISLWGDAVVLTGKYTF